MESVVAGRHCVGCRDRWQLRAGLRGSDVRGAVASGLVIRIGTRKDSPSVGRN